MFQAKRQPATVSTIIPGKTPEHFLLTSDGIKLHYSSWLPSGRVIEKIILCIPGYNSDLRYFRAFGSYMSSSKIGVFAYDQRGFGESGGKASIKKSLEDIECFIDYLKSRYPHTPIILLGHSVGAAAYAMKYASGHNAVIDSLMLVVPATKIKFKVWFNHFLRSCGLKPWFKLTDPETQKEIKLDNDKPVNYSPWHVLSIVWSCNFLSRFVAPKIQVPTLVIQSDPDFDIIIDSRDVFKTTKKIPRSIVLSYEQSGHLVFTGFSPLISEPLQEQREEVYAHMYKWAMKQPRT